jgi:hypothetical protein
MNKQLSKLWVNLRDINRLDSTCKDVTIMDYQMLRARQQIIRHLKSLDNIKCQLECPNFNAMPIQIIKNKYQEMIKILLEKNNFEVLKKINISNGHYIIATIPDICSTNIPMFIETHDAIEGCTITINKEGENLIYDFTKKDAMLTYFNSYNLDNISYQKILLTRDNGYNGLRDTLYSIFRKHDIFNQAVFADLPNKYILINSDDLRELNMKQILNSMDKQ